MVVDLANSISRLNGLIYVGLAVEVRSSAAVEVSGEVAVFLNGFVVAVVETAGS